MKKKQAAVALFLAGILLSSLVATAAASDFFPFSSYITTSGTASAQGTVDDTISITYTTFGSGGKETAEWISENIIQNPSALSWNSHMTITPVEGKLSWNYVRTGGPLPFTSVSTRQSFFR